MSASGGREASWYRQVPHWLVSLMLQPPSPHTKRSQRPQRAIATELWQMSRDGYLASGITARAMHHFCFAKSSFILQRVASRPDLRTAVRPVAVKVSHVGSDAKRQALVPDSPECWWDL